jgi:hypothetical protein
LMVSEFWIVGEWFINYVTNVCAKQRQNYKNFVQTLEKILKISHIKLKNLHDLHTWSIILINQFILFRFRYVPIKKIGDFRDCKLVSYEILKILFVQRFL